MTTDAPTPCQKAGPYVYDLLIDYLHDPNRDNGKGNKPPHITRYAMQEAADLCAGCPINTQCLLVDNIEEPWAQGIARELHRRNTTTTEAVA